jgi:hypothetical protein
MKPFFWNVKGVMNMDTWKASVQIRFIQNLWEGFQMHTGEKRIVDLIQNPKKSKKV